eukprot:4554214-Prymnesium_polylepis.1
MLLNDSDWVENGKLEQLREFQSEYWTIVSYCLFVSNKGSISLAEGAYYATIEQPATEADASAPYVVKDADGATATVPRERLRHRKWHTTGFVGVTNEKRHDGATTQGWTPQLPNSPTPQLPPPSHSQGMFNRQLGYWARRSSKKGNTTDENLRASHAAAAAAATAASAAADRVARAAAALAEAEAALQEDDEYRERIKEVEAAREAARAAAADASTAEGPTPRIYDEARFDRCVPVRACACACVARVCACACMRARASGA